jgi:hypothetical protein
MIFFSSDLIIFFVTHSLQALSPQQNKIIGSFVP